MTNTPAAWYPDPNGSPQQRWWDGTQWTEHVAAGQPQGAAPLPQSTLSSTSTNTPFIWVYVALPVLSLIGLLFWDLDAYYAAALNPDPTNPFAAFDGGYLLVVGLSFVVYALGVIFAWLDHRALRDRGVARPFHWAWTFLNSLVYIIGRTVILRRQQRPALAPLFAYIAVVVLVYVVTFIKVGVAVSNAMGSIY